MPRKLPFDPPSDAAILLAAEREVAEKATSTRNPDLVSYTHDDAIAHRLELPTRGAGSRWLPAQLRRLAAQGLLVRHEEYGPWYMVTGGGEEILRSLEAAGELPELPESPAHKKWRTSREACEQHLPAFAQELCKALEEGVVLAALGTKADSAKLLAAGDRIEKAFGKMASVTYVLTEWPEPEDFKPEEEPIASDSGIPDLDESLDRISSLNLTRLRNSWSW